VARPTPSFRIPLEMAQRILLAEDEEPLREILTEALRDEGFEVIAAADGREALELFHARGPFDLVLLDEEMPRMTGRQLLAQLRESGSRIAALLFSGHLDLSAAEQARLGVGPVLRKPLALADLGPAIRKAIRDAPP
jgi:CheY-like chemotaxis protein